jgi:O-6-methylguanine DNA methyltransferase
LARNGEPQRILTSVTMKLHAHSLLRTTVRHAIANVTVFAKETPSGLVLAGISFGLKETLGGDRAAESANGDLIRWAGLVESFLSGTGQSLLSLPLDLRGCTPFTKAVLRACRTIPRGATVSYSRLAEMAGYPRAVRAAASVMRNNSFPLAVPCHRVIAKNGGLGGFMGALRGSPLALKQALLALERGVRSRTKTGS